MTKEKEYKWRKGSRCSINADVFGVFIDKIGDAVEAKDVVDAARPANSPIHTAFEWDDSQAGELFRREQARLYLRSLQVYVKVDESKDVEPRWINVKTEDESKYVTNEVIAENEDYKQAALRDCIKQIRGLQKRFAFLNALKPLWKAVDRTIKKLELEVTK